MLTELRPQLTKSGDLVNITTVLKVQQWIRVRRFVWLSFSVCGKILQCSCQLIYVTLVSSCVKVMTCNLGWRINRLWGRMVKKRLSIEMFYIQVALLAVLVFGVAWLLLSRLPWTGTASSLDAVYDAGHVTPLNRETHSARRSSSAGASGHSAATGHLTSPRRQKLNATCQQLLDGNTTAIAEARQTNNVSQR